MATATSSPFKLRNPYNHFHVFRIAIFSRLLILTLIFLFRSLTSPYDTSASINPNCLSSSSTHLTRSEPVLFPAVGSAIESSIVWDAVYFVRIAECGYEYEQTYAFLPLLPICIRLLARSVLAPLVPIIGYRAVLGLSGYVINNIAFAFAAVYLYWLSILILKDSVAAFRASILFCFNPASIFYSSVYSESLYSLFSFGGIYHLLAGSNTIAVLLFALSGSARSNGVLNAGYFCFKALHQAYDSFFHKNRPFFAVGRLTLAAFQTLCIFTPFITFQAYGYLNICLGSLPNEARPWCKSRVPLLYDYLQSHYWGVGFLRYFQLKQLPNFLLASPILSLAISSIIQYVKSRAEVVFSLGFGASHEEKEFASVLYSLDTNQRLMGVKSFSSKIAKGKLLMAKYPSLFWTPCAAHCIDLILHDIGKLSIVKKTLKKAISLNGYIYNHPFVLNMMRSFTKQRELIRPAVTRFATAYLTLQSIHNQKNSLRAMFCSEEWLNSRYHRDTGGRVAYETVMQTSFWTNILYVLKVTAPIVRVLRLVDSEKKPAMGYIYEAMDRAKEAIKRSFNDNEAKYGEIWNIIDLRWNAQLHHPLHAAGYYLNPEFYYTTEMIESIEELNYGLVTTIEKLIPDVRLQDRIHQELNIFREAVGLMGSSTAIRHRTTLSPDQALRQRKKKTEAANRETLRDLTRPNHEAFSPSKIGFSSILVLPFVLHLGFMSVVAFFVMHVQVSTRFLSSSPPLYWFSSYLMVSSREGRTWAYLIWVYSVAYILLGSLLFSNFYPFT